MQESSMRKTLSSTAPPDVDFYAAISSSHLMPNTVDLSDEIQGMISHDAMMSKRAKVNVVRCMQEIGQLGVPKAREFVEAGNDV